jgi:hypothetical protein
MGYPFPSPPQGGRKRYLPDYDADRLFQVISEANENLAPMSVPDVIDAAHQLKIQRVRVAIGILSSLKSWGLCEQFEKMDVDPPSRSWINFFSDEKGLKLKFAQPIDPARLSSACHSKIQRFFDQFGSLMRSYPKELVFGCDETMINLIKTTKCVVPNKATPITEREKQIHHITMMLAHSCGGAKVPPYILVPNLKKESADIQELKSSVGEVWFCSSKSGWQTRETFFLWAINFAHWTTLYRAQLPPCLKASGLLLILDGHSSRQCPAALEIFRAFQIRVLVLPSHCSHILQMFDVGLAAGMKRSLSKYYKESKQDASTTFQARLATDRYNAIIAGVKAWNAFASPDMCRLSAKLVGLFPFNPQGVLSGCFVTPDQVVNNRWPPRDTRNFLDINSHIITQPDMIQTIRTHIEKTCPNFQLMYFDVNQPYVTELYRLYNGIQAKFPLFTPMTNLTAHASLCLEINASDGIICVDEVFFQMNKQSTLPVSHETYFDERYVLLFPPDSFPFHFDCQDLIHESELFRVIKSHYIKDSEIHVCCLKLFAARENLSDFVNECLCKLIKLKSQYSEGFHGATQSQGSCYLVHDYYNFTVETLFNMAAGVDKNGWRFIMRQMLVCVIWLTSIGYIHTSLKLSSFRLSDINNVKLGGLCHAVPFSDFHRKEPRYLDYCPPEFILGDRTRCEGYTVWNLACLFFEIIAFEKPFGSHCKNPVQHLDTIMSMSDGRDAVAEPEFWKALPLTSLLRPDPVKDIWDDLSNHMPDDPVFRDLMRVMLMIDVNQRWTLKRCLSHNFFAGLPLADPRPLDLAECPSMTIFENFYEVRQG